MCVCVCLFSVCRFISELDLSVEDVCSPSFIGKVKMISAQKGVLCVSLSVLFKVTNYACTSLTLHVRITSDRSNLTVYNYD